MDIFPITYNLIQYRHKPIFRNLMSVLFSITLIIIIGLEVFLIVNITAPKLFSSIIIICSSIALFFIASKIENIWLYDTSITGLITFTKDTISINDTIHSFDNLKRVILSNNIQPISSSIPYWKRSYKLEIVYSIDNVEKFYISMKPLNDSDCDLRIVFDAMRKTSMDVYRKTENLT